MHRLYVFSNLETIDRKFYYLLYSQVITCNVLKLLHSVHLHTFVQNSEQNAIDAGPKSITVLKRHPFLSSLQRSSSIVQVNTMPSSENTILPGDCAPKLLVKGAPEVISSLCLEQSGMFLPSCTSYTDYLLYRYECISYLLFTSLAITY